jgi:hypothetical protein
MGPGRQQWSANRWRIRLFELTWNRNNFRLRVRMVSGLEGLALTQHYDLSYTQGALCRKTTWSRDTARFTPYTLFPYLSLHPNVDLYL